MDREKALGELSTAHAVALRMSETEASAAEIARALGIPVEGVEPLLAVARAKLDALAGARRPEVSGRD